MKADKPSHLVPRLRFPEFRDSQGWSLRPLGEVLTPIVREREKPIHPYTGLGIRSHGRGTFRKELEQPEKTSMKRLYEVNCNDLIVNITFAWEGAIAIVRPEDTGALVSHRFPTYQFDQNAVLSGFFRYPIHDQQFIYNLGVISPGGAGRNRVLNKSDFLKIELALPEIAEQQKIADCLGSLDDLIAAEGRKLEALRQHKQGLMQRLFPRPGETVPRLRFPEFVNEPAWTELTIGNVCGLKAGDFTPASEITEFPDEGSFPCYGANGLRGYVKSFTHEGQYVLVGRQGALCGNVNLYTGKFHATEHALVATPKSVIDTGWLFYALDVLKLNRYSTGQAQPGLSVGVLNGVGISIPTGNNEQQKIADCLGSLDDLIAAEGRKLEALRQHKQGLMQQLFPSPEVK